MNHRFTTHLTALAAVALLLFGASQAFAIGTEADTTISNTASVEFTIGGSTPAPIDSLPAELRASLQQLVPFPARFGEPEEFAALVRHILDNQMLNGEVIRLDGALRMPPA